MNRSQLYPEKLVQRVNELYHDFTKYQYDFLHPEIFEQEKHRWERIATQFFNFVNPITVVDIGTGTGFVPLTTAKLLKKDDTFVCSDISTGVLEVAKQNIDMRAFHCQFRFIRIERQIPLRLPHQTGSADIVTMNSVLHHVWDTDTFLEEVNRILKPNGLLFVAHEPNRCFYDNRLLWYNYLFVEHLLDPRLTLYRILRAAHLEEKAEKVYYAVGSRKRQAALDQERVACSINEVLLEEQLVQQPLTAGEIYGAIDVRNREGFQPNSLLPDYRVLHIETYNHMLWVTITHYGNFVIRWYDSVLRRKYPREGATFFVVLRKRC